MSDQIPEDVKPADKLTIKEVDDLMAELLKKEEEKEKIEATLKDVNKEISRLEAKATQYLEELGREDYDSPVGKAKIVEKWRVNLPDGEQAKKEFFEHLRERGIFDKYATVNSNSLNALYMADWRVAKEEGRGIEFAMPGIGAPQLHRKLDFKPRKK